MCECRFGFRVWHDPMMCHWSCGAGCAFCYEVTWPLHGDDSKQQVARSNVWHGVVYGFVCGHNGVYKVLHGACGGKALFSLVWL